MIIDDQLRLKVGKTNADLLVQAKPWLNRVLLKIHRSTAQTTTCKQLVLDNRKVD